jgi:hypothetical protein
MNRLFLILFYFCVGLGGLSAQNVELARERLFEADFDAAKAALNGGSATAEVHLLRAIADAGGWFGSDVNAYLKSLGLKAGAVDRLTDLQTAVANEDPEWFLEDHWIQVESTPLDLEIVDGERVYEFPHDQENVLVMRNLTGEALTVSLTAEFASGAGSESDAFEFYRAEDWWASADAYRWESADWDYQEWYNDQSSVRTFSIALEPGERVRIEHDVDDLAPDTEASISTLAFPASLITGGSLEIQNGQYDRYNTPRDPANGFFNLTSTGISDYEDALWREDGQIELMEGAVPVIYDLDYWVSQNDLLYSWDDPKFLTFTYNGTTKTQVDFQIIMDDMYDYGSDYEGEIFINGLSVGYFSRWAIDWLGQDVYLPNDGHYYGYYGDENTYTLSLPLHPGDVLTISVENSGWYYGRPGGGFEEEPLVGIAFMAPVSGLSVLNGTAPEIPFPEFASGTDTRDIADAFFGISGELSTLLGRIISHLEAIQPGEYALFSPEDTGLFEELRVEHTDVQLILAGLKLFQGVQLLISMQDDGQNPLQWSTFEPYLENPVQFWEDNPDSLTLIQVRSGQGLQAKALFEEAIAHYRLVEDDLWSRGDGVGWRYLFEISDPINGPTQAEIAEDFAAFESSLTGEVAFNVIDEYSEEDGALSLVPFFDGTPPSLRGYVPAFDELGFFQGGTGPFSESGFVTGYTPYDYDLMLFDAGLMLPDAIRSLAGKVFIGYEQTSWWPPQYQDWPSYVAYFDTDSVLYVPIEGVGQALDYTWDPGESSELTITDPLQTFEFEFESASAGTYWTYGPAINWESGRFVLYDASFDLDRNGTGEGDDILSGLFPEPYVDMLGDWDGDLLGDEEEELYSTDPTRVDSDEDGLGDFHELSVYNSNPNSRDSDRDGFEDGFEIANGTMPSEASSLPEVFLEIALTEFFSTPTIDLNFKSPVGGILVVEKSENLTAWEAVQFLSGEGRESTVVIPRTLNKAGYFRIRIVDQSL